MSSSFSYSLLFLQRKVMNVLKREEIKPQQESKLGIEGHDWSFKDPSGPLTQFADAHMIEKMPRQLETCPCASVSVCASAKLNHCWCVLVCSGCMMCQVFFFSPGSAEPLCFPFTGFSLPVPLSPASSRRIYDSRSTQASGLADR